MDNYQNGGYNPYGQGQPQGITPHNPTQAPSTQQQQQQGGLASFGALSAQAQQQGHQQLQSPQHTTLPPLQGQNGYSFGALSYPHPGQSQPNSAPHTPSQATMAGNVANAFSHMGPAGAGPPGSMLPPSGMQNPYVTQAMMYPPAGATSMPPTTSSMGLPTIRPMPPGGVTGSNGLPSLASAGHLGQLGQQPSFMQNEEAPTHVVGSQGRRGILPSAPGRPNPPAQGSGTSTKSMIPQKDADGKYPCPHCNKTYLHAKHLKRHLLRHTGDRPYMCHLCKDTFSRSDILKRHFQKCSLRRGNPTGANHLAHQRRNTNNGNRLSMSQQEGPVGLAGMPEINGNTPYNANVVGSSPHVSADISARSSRANSLINPGNMSQRNGVAGLGILGSNTPNAEHLQQSTSAPFQPGLHAYAMQNSANGAHMPSNYSYNQPQMNGNVYANTQNPQQLSFLGQTSSRLDHSQVNNSHHQMPNGDGTTVDWNRMFTQSGQDGYIGSHSANASSQGVNIKTEAHTKHDYSSHPDFSDESFLGSLYSHPSGFGGEDPDSSIPGLWASDDPLQAKVDNLMQHCFPHGSSSVQGNPAAQIMQTCLKAENVKHFAEHYTSFHGHWPILHMPTFKLTDADNNLVLAIICIGAVYSPRLSVHQTRQLMEFVRSTVYSTSSIHNRVLSGQTDSMGNQPFEIEELQALSMLQTLFTWHGDPAQRQGARAEYPSLVRIANAMNLCETAPNGHYAWSMLHSPRNSQASQTQAQNWDWRGWLEQEKRNRLLYQLLVTDAAMVMYFNSVPQFDPLEIHLTLPADDAAWDASSASECADALGLNGIHAQTKNVSGTRKSVQLTMRNAMRTTLDQYGTFQPGTTNVYSKFLLIHALIIRIVVCQKSLLQPDGPVQPFTLNLNGSAPATPISQNDWLEQHGGARSASNSGQATPEGGFSPKQSQNLATQQEKKRLAQGLEKWKRNWDTDIEIQYPPTRYQQRRFGFSRDGVHFFYLGRSFLQSQQASDWTLPPDMRFKCVMALLKRIKSMVVGDNETKGQDIGSVGDIDDQYGLDNLTLDMKLLFKPYNSLLDSPVIGVQTNA